MLDTLLLSDVWWLVDRHDVVSMGGRMGWGNQGYRSAYGDSVEAVIKIHSFNRLFFRAYLKSLSQVRPSGKMLPAGRFAPLLPEGFMADHGGSFA
ncbi:hypothetical protein [Rhizobium sp. 9140]|uniref:hypothetical protein n=1 Tax=Rhizobium sp. 9140 TaxID=1761900 RepID=UPI001586CBD0|nr:hypothetical protein [Rhizobium sp. 9140]